MHSEAGEASLLDRGARFVFFLFALLLSVVEFAKDYPLVLVGEHAVREDVLKYRDLLRYRGLESVCILLGQSMRYQSRDEEGQGPRRLKMTEWVLAACLRGGDDPAKKKNGRNRQSRKLFGGGFKAIVEGLQGL